MRTAAFSVMSVLAACAFSADALLVSRQSTPPNATDIKTAVYAWQADTGTVSNFLNNAAARSFNSQSEFHSAAVAAYNAELDELIHKQVLDNELPSTSPLEQANTTLVADGTFQSVVDLLHDLTTLHVIQQAKIRHDVHMINFGHNGIAGRCKAVLPAIDTYFSQAAQEVQSLDGDRSLNGVQAIRPTACSESS